MYTNSYSKVTSDEEILQILKENNFATIVSVDAELNPMATHLPLDIVKKSNNQVVIFGHIAKANPQWKTFSQDKTVLAIFQGANSYISPSWYNHANVPTWNYIAVHVKGKIEIIDGEILWKEMKDLMLRYESHFPQGVRFEDLPSKMLEEDMRGIVGFYLHIEDVQAVKKLSQNRDKESFFNIIRNLEEINTDNSTKIAQEMRQLREE